MYSTFDVHSVICRGLYTDSSIYIVSDRVMHLRQAFVKTLTV